MRMGRHKTDFLNWWKKIKESESDEDDNVIMEETTKNPVAWMNATSNPIYFPSTTPKSKIISTMDVRGNDPSLKVSYDGEALLVEGIGGGAGGTLVVALLIFGIYFM